MRKITPLTWLIAGLMTVLAIVFSGCSTEDPWNPTQTQTLTLSLVAGPSDSADVPMGNSISFSWTSSGGSGQIQYQYSLDDDSWSALSRITIATLSAPSEGEHTFHVRAQDAVNNTDEISAFFVVTAGAPDTQIPVVTINESPSEGSFIATGSNVTFSWQGYDSLGSGDRVMYQYSWAGVISEWDNATTVSFTNVSADTAAAFSVWAKDEAGNVSDPASVSFVIKDASILLVDDYQWLDAFGNVDMAKEREQRAFYRSALEGYAFAEWEIATQGMPDSSYIIDFSTVIFASDSHLNDASTTWWYEVGAAGGGVVRYYMENGGHLLAAGASILRWIYNNNPPAAGDFEYDWLGIGADSTNPSWDYWADFTWAVNGGDVAGLPDSMKIDVGKNGDQVDYAEDIFTFREGATVMYVKGLDIDGAEPADYGESVGHIFAPGGGAARSAMLNFDVFSMPLPEIKQTFQVILTEFGE